MRSESIVCALVCLVLSKGIKAYTIDYETCGEYSLAISDATKSAFEMAAAGLRGMDTQPGLRALLFGAKTDPLLFRDAKRER